MNTDELALTFINFIEQISGLHVSANKVSAFYVVNDEEHYVSVMVVDYGGDKVKAAMAAINQAVAKKKEIEHAKGSKP